MEKFEAIMKKMMAEQEERLKVMIKEMLNEQMVKFNDRLEKIENNLISNKNDIKNIEKEVK